MPLELLNLPNEIIGHVFGFLDAIPPSELNAKEHPSRPLVSSDTSLPLKNASNLSQRLRTIALPYLYRHIVAFPNSLDRILDFTAAQKLAVHVVTAQIYLAGPSSHHQPPWWRKVLDACPNLTTLDITAPPHVFAEITQCPIKLQDAWAFKIGYQRLQLSCQPPGTSPSEMPTRSTSFLLTARPWTSLHVNESSSLPAYTTYEYFLRTPPCPLPPASTLSHSVAAHHPLSVLLRNLRSFHFTAIFPTYNHVAEVTSLIESHMHNLESLAFQLLPKPSSTILSDTLEATGNHIDVNDPWNEFETSLLLIARVVLSLSRASAEDGDFHGTEGSAGTVATPPSSTGTLRELRMEDVAMEGVRHTIEERITKELTDKPELGWEYKGAGIWRRSSSTTADTSADAELQGQT